MNSRRGSTFSPISTRNRSSAAAASRLDDVSVNFSSLDRKYRRAFEEGSQRQLLLNQVTEQKAKLAALDRQRAQREAEGETEAYRQADILRVIVHP